MLLAGLRLLGVAVAKGTLGLAHVLGDAFEPFLRLAPLLAGLLRLLPEVVRQPLRLAAQLVLVALELVDEAFFVLAFELVELVLVGEVLLPARQLADLRQRLVEGLILLLLLALLLHLVLVLVDVEFEVHQFGHALFGGAAALAALVHRYLLLLVERVGAEEVRERLALGRQRLLQPIRREFDDGIAHLADGLPQILNDLLILLAGP